MGRRHSHSQAMDDTKMQVSLPPKLDAFVKEKVESGEFKDASGVMSEAVRLMQAHDDIRRQKLERLRAEIAKGEADFANGRFTEVRDDEELAEFFARL